MHARHVVTRNEMMTCRSVTTMSHFSHWADLTPIPAISGFALTALSVAEQLDWIFLHFSTMMTWPALMFGGLQRENHTGDARLLSASYLSSASRAETAVRPYRQGCGFRVVRGPPRNRGVRSAATSAIPKRVVCKCRWFCMQPPTAVFVIWRWPRSRRISRI